ncbi:MAG: transposase [Candidatus Omnitrophota bacterium]
MARIARVVVSGFPHHVVQRGNRRQKVFFRDEDYKEYLRLLGEHSRQSSLDIIAYCLMPNHVHLIVVPAKAESLAKAIAETHRNYTRMINFRERWRGYLWQGRFSSYVLDEQYLLSATRYILLNPVRAKIVERPWDYKWSSAQHHLKIKTDPLISEKFLSTLIDDWKEFLQAEVEQKIVSMLRLHEGTGRPLGNVAFIEKLEKILGRSLKKKKPGPKNPQNSRRKNNNN